MISKSLPPIPPATFALSVLPTSTDYTILSLSSQKPENPHLTFNSLLCAIASSSEIYPNPTTSLYIYCCPSHSNHHLFLPGLLHLSPTSWLLISALSPNNFYSKFFPSEWNPPFPSRIITANHLLRLTVGQHSDVHFNLLEYHVWRYNYHCPFYRRKVEA